MMNTILTNLIAELQAESAQIPTSRKEQLSKLREYVEGNHLANLNFICTHNSRRSHLGMIWAAVAAYVSGRQNLEAYSGGTEATAMNLRTVAALRRAGFRVHDPGGDNPEYLVCFAEDAAPLRCFSKRYDHPDNPEKSFAAVMTCDHADQNCPFIPGADLRLPLTYEDPKAADDTPEEATRYDERLRQIGREMLWALSGITQ